MASRGTFLVQSLNILLLITRAYHFYIGRMSLSNELKKSPPKRMSKAHLYIPLIEEEDKNYFNDTKDCSKGENDRRSTIKNNKY